MKKILALMVLAGGVFFTSCGTGTQRDDRDDRGTPDVRDTVYILETETDTMPAAPAPTP
jgi:hypothetical protein